MAKQETNTASSKGFAKKAPIKAKKSDLKLGGANPPVFKRLDFSAGCEARFVTSAEPFTETIKGEELTTLRKRSRQYVGSGLDFMLSDALGVTLKYRYGPLPPAF